MKCFYTTSEHFATDVRSIATTVAQAKEGRGAEPVKADKRKEQSSKPVDFRSFGSMVVAVM